VNSEQAWQSALGQLQMEMPKASFDTWVRDTRVLSYEDGLFTIGVHNDYARAWLESRLSSTVTRLLMGIMNRGVEVRFVVHSDSEAGVDASRFLKVHDAWNKVLETLGKENLQGEAVNILKRGTLDGRDLDSDTLTVCLTKDDYETLFITLENSQIVNWATDRLRTELDDAKINIFLEITNQNDLAENSDEIINKPGEAESASEQDSIAEQLNVEIVHDTRYSEEVVPDSVVVLDGYTFRLLEQGDIDHNQISLYLGYHQAVWRKWKQGKGATQNISWREVSSWAMMSRAVFFKEIAAGMPLYKNGVLDPGKGRGKALYGLVERVDIANNRHYRTGSTIRTIANRYRVHMSPRLTRQDAANLDLLLRSKLGTANDKDHTRLITILDELTKLPQITDILTGETLDRENLPIVATVMDIVRNIAHIKGDLPEPLRAAAEKLHVRILKSFGKIYITQYFIRTVFPALRLTRPQAWLVIWLRDKCYSNPETGEKRDIVLVEGGIAALARKLHVNRNAIFNWLSLDANGNPKTPVPCFIAKVEFDSVLADFKARGIVAFQVRIEEPLVSELVSKNNGEPLRVPYGGRRIARRCKDCKRDVYELGEAFTLNNKSIKAAGITRSSVLCVACAETRLGRALIPTDFGRVGDEMSTLLRQRVGNSLGDAPKLETPDRPNLRLDAPNLEIPVPNLETPVYANLRLVAPKLETPFKLFKHSLNSEEIPDTTSSATPPPEVVVPSTWNITRIFNLNPTSTQIRIALANTDPRSLISWLLYAVSPDGKGIDKPWGWALAQLRDAPEMGAGAAYDKLAALPPHELVRLIRYSNEKSTSHYQSTEEFIHGLQMVGSRNALWDKTMGIKNARVGCLLKILIDYDPNDGEEA
jgi:hypothetical protein